MWNFKQITSTIFKRRTVYADNFIFRCFYRGSFWILAMGSMLLSLKQYFGEHIHCIAHESLKHVINTFCFFSTTFTVVKHHYSKTVPHPGVGPVEDNDQVIHHAYYQWVAFFLFSQAICFYIPHWLWKLKEKGRLAKWVENPVPKEYVAERLQVYRNWTRWLVFCEILNVFNLVFQVYLTDVFLKYRFMDLGYNYDDLETVFPKVTKCTWRQYGKSGTMQKHDALCVIALNVINEKIFIVVWFWYVILAFISLSGLLWRLLTVIFHKNSFFNSFLFSSFMNGPNLKPSQAERIAYYTDFWEWLFVYYLCKNMKLKDLSGLIAGLGPQNRQPQATVVSYPDVKRIDTTALLNGSALGPQNRQPQAMTVSYPDLKSIDTTALINGSAPSAPTLTSNHVESDC